MKHKIHGLYFIINTASCPDSSLANLALQAIRGGINALQFRHKGPYTKQIFSAACEIAELCHQFHIPLIINDRLDIALAVQAAGVHLGSTDLPIAAARNYLGPHKIIGATASHVEQAQQAAREGADYIGFGHIFPTESKLKANPPLGLEPLKQACQNVPIPILAIGGINEHNLTLVYHTGVCGVAVLSAIGAAADPFSQTKKLKNLMISYEHSPLP